MQTNYCSKCGSEMRGMNYCPSCGTSVDQMNNENRASAQPQKKKSNPVMIILIVIAVLFFGTAILGILAAILVPNFLRARAQGQFTQCQSNMKNIGTALEMYSTDNAGHYPDSLEKLKPDYLRVIPTCASSATDTYSDSYDFFYTNEENDQDRYTFFCKGHNHRAVGITEENYPQYNSTEGLRARP